MLVVDKMAGLPKAKIGTGATPLLVTCTLPLTDKGLRVLSIWADTVLEENKSNSSNTRVTVFKWGNFIVYDYSVTIINIYLT